MSKRKSSLVSPILLFLLGGLCLWAGISLGPEIPNHGMDWVDYVRATAALVLVTDGTVAWIVLLWGTMLMYLDGNL